jgi:HEAT repeats
VVPRSSDIVVGVQPATEPPERTVIDRRRAVALAGHTGDRTLARGALSDVDPSVRASALAALERLGDLADDELRAALVDDAPAVRRRACELAVGHPAVGLAQALRDPDAGVVERAASSAGERADLSLVPVLAAIAAGPDAHPDPLCREAAVAALGATGDPSGLPAVLEALGDKPAVRRRAAVALAAFDGPSVEAALRRCLTDRDWQVRQVAEDLLDDG